MYTGGRQTDRALARGQSIDAAELTNRSRAAASVSAASNRYGASELRAGGYFFLTLSRVVLELDEGK